jgi:hypothetical protein
MASNEMHRATPFVLLAVLFTPPSASARADSSAFGTPSVKGDAKAGYATISWSAPKQATKQAVSFELQHARNASFGDAKLRYRGPHQASMLSGLPDGTHYFRVRSLGKGGQPLASWSKPASFVVAHHSRRFALTLFGMGALVFALIVVFLLSTKSHPASASRGDR